MSYKNMVGILAFVLCHAVYATGTVINEDAVRSEASSRISAAAIQNALCEILSTLEDLKCPDDLCEATVITEAQILSESGVYCLGNDVTGTIFIAGSSITLNLNGHIVLSGSDGIAVASTARDVRIRNGMVRGASGEDRGIFVNGATDVRIEDVTCENWETGIYVLDSFTVTCDRVICSDNRVEGAKFENSTGVVVRDSAFNGSNIVGASVLSGSAVEFINCSSTSGVSTDCLRQLNVAGMSAIDFLRAGKGTARACSAMQIGFLCFESAVIYRDCTSFTSIFGFLCDVGQTDAFNCVAEGNIIGFSLGGDRHSLTNCLAENNAEVGFLSAPAQGEVIFRDCIAKGNLGNGFFEDEVAPSDAVSNMYLNCVACNNGINYSPNIIAANNAPVTTPTAARGFDNIDCSLSEPATCAAKMVSEPQTLTEPGIYCLTNDIFGTITIAGNGITLDLNGYTIHNQPLRVSCGNDGICMTRVDGIRIKNGRVEGPYTDNIGISISTCSNVTIEDVVCEGWNAGIQIVSGIAITIDRVSASFNNQGVSCSLANVIMRDSIFDYNFNDGVYMTDISQVELVRCTATGDPGNNVPTDVITFGRSGFHVAGFEVETVFRDCSAFIYPIGFLVECPARVDMYNCVAENTFEGFVLDGVRVYALNCAANNSFVGFLMPARCDDGFVTLRNCYASGNRDFGFLDESIPTDTSVNMYLNCVACKNGTNYSSNIIASNNAPVASAATATGYSNVTCS
ncbi:MAG TPA: right-handed parallel beta-helix repeat-containing protein [Candidatus Babeliales bacterium]|nr:right-handed parallel beta-helix repeat-containing protein [Candidatus Babeliales bacterium]